MGYIGGNSKRYIQLFRIIDASIIHNTHTVIPACAGMTGLLGYLGLSSNARLSGLIDTRS